MNRSHRQYIHLHETSDTTLVLHDTETRLLVWIHLESMLIKKQTYGPILVLESLTLISTLRVSNCISAASRSATFSADAHFLITPAMLSRPSHGFNRSPLITPWPSSQPGPSKPHSSPFAMQLCRSIIGKAKHRLNPIWRVSTWSLAETAGPWLNWSSLRSGLLCLSEAAGGDRKT